MCNRTPDRKRILLGLAVLAGALGLLAALLFSLNAAHLFISQASRMYGLTQLLEVLFFGCLPRDLAQPSWKRFACYSAIVVAGSRS